MANGEAVDPVPIEDDPASFERLTKELLDVLSDESATMIPPSAGGMDRAEWSRLSPRERAGYGRRQLRSLDPRLLPRAVLRWSSRRYSHSPH